MLGPFGISLGGWTARSSSIAEREQILLELASHIAIPDFIDLIDGTFVQVICHPTSPRIERLLPAIALPMAAALGDLDALAADGSLGTIPAELLVDFEKHGDLLIPGNMDALPSDGLDLELPERGLIRVGSLESLDVAIASSLADPDYIADANPYYLAFVRDQLQPAMRVCLTHRMILHGE